MRVRATRQQMTAAVSMVVAGLTGRDSRYAGIGFAVLTRIGNAALSQIQQDFVRKSRGGIGLDGIQWKPLSPETIARRTVAPRDEKAVRKRLAEEREAVYKRELARLRAGAFSYFYPRTEADHATDLATDRRLQKQAAKYARDWAEAHGRQLRKQVLSQRQVDILRDTGAMLRAFTPGVADHVPADQSTVFEVRPAQVTVGNREKPWHQTGGKNLPARPFWPVDGQIPDAWWPAIHLAAERGIRDAMRLIVQQGRV